MKFLLLILIPLFVFAAEDSYTSTQCQKIDGQNYCPLNYTIDKFLQDPLGTDCNQSKRIATDTTRLLAIWDCQVWKPQTGQLPMDQTCDDCQLVTNTVPTAKMAKHPAAMAGRKILAATYQSCSVLDLPPVDVTSSDYTNMPVLSKSLKHGASEKNLNKH